MQNETTFKCVNPSYVPIGLAKEAVKTFGEENQIMKCLEEMAELQQALLKYLQDRDTLEHVQEEIADVRIMMAQMCYIFGKMGVYKYTTEKLERLEQRIREKRDFENLAAQARDALLCSELEIPPLKAVQNELDFENVK